jgi:hypothetical protein
MCVSFGARSLSDRPRRGLITATMWDSKEVSASSQRQTFCAFDNNPKTSWPGRFLSEVVFSRSLPGSTVDYTALRWNILDSIGENMFPEDVPQSDLGFIVTIG